jgi:hypothetical protein
VSSPFLRITQQSIFASMAMESHDVFSVIAVGSGSRRELGTEEDQPRGGKDGSREYFRILKRKATNMASS